MGTLIAEGPLRTEPLSVPDTYPTPPSSRASSFSNDTTLKSENQQELFRLTTENPFRRNPSLSTSLPWRRHPKTPTFVEAESSSAVYEEEASEKARHNVNNLVPEHALSLKKRFRRASVTLIKGFCGSDTNSVTEQNQHEHRPTTAQSTWHRLRQATSFRHLRTSYGDRLYPGTVSSQHPSDFLEMPVPGNGFAPPIIPHHTGAAAKASVALQNEYITFARQQQEWLSDELNDHESGIGIAVAATEVQGKASTEQETQVLRVDFIGQLPPELASQILAYLDAHHLAAASRVSRYWREVTRDQLIWKESFLREKTMTFATTRRAQPGTGSGIPSIRPGNDWLKIYQAREELEKRWKVGKQAHSIYLNGHLDSIYCLQFDEKKIITGSRDKTIRIWDMRTYQCRLVIGPPEVVNNNDNPILFDPNGKPTHFASYGGSERINPSVPVTVSFPTHHKASILCLQYDDEILVTGSSDSTCIIYSVRSGYRPIRRLEHHTAAILDLAFDDKHIVTCSKDITICVWDRETGTLIKQLRGHTGPVNSVQLRGNTIVSCSGDFRVKLWNIDSGKTVREFAGHTKGLACSQFSEDGRFIASAGSDKIIRIWDANTGECLHEMQAHEMLVRSLHIDSISGRLISGSYDTDIKVFDMETGAQLLDFPHWHASWVLSAKSDYRRIISTGQDPKILIMDFGADVKDIRMLESNRKNNHVTFEPGFI